MSDNMTVGQEWREGMAAINPIRTTGCSAPPACEPSSTRPILLSRHQIEPQDIEAVTAMLKSGEDLTRGRQTRAFEEEFAAYAGARYAVACSSGTAALWLAAQACSVISGPWQVPAITFAATRNALDSFEIVDCDPDTGLGKFTQDPALAVMYAGQTAGGGNLIVDAAHALGSVLCDGIKVGGKATLTCFSFHPAKTITTGEGGMVTTPDEGLAREMRRLRDNGIVRSRKDPPGWYDNSGFGLNFHMGEMGAALGRSQLRRIESILQERRNLVRHYLFRIPDSVRPILQSEGGYCDEDMLRRNACHIFPVLIDFEALGTTRERVMYDLLRRGIETNVHYVPLKRGLPGAEEFYRRELTLPLHCGMTLQDVGYVCAVLAEVLHEQV